MEQTEQNRKSGIWKMIGALVVIVAAVFGWVKMKGTSTTSSAPLESINPNVTENTTPVPGKYKDGTYTAHGTYRSPAGTEQVDVTVGIQDGTVVSATFQGMPLSEESSHFQGRFNSGFQSYVIGKNIDSIKLTKVNGSSLAPKGFMDALNQIKTQAQA